MQDFKIAIPYNTFKTAQVNERVNYDALRE